MGKVYHASYSGWFPFCVSKIDPAIPELYSVVKLKTVMKLWWRIKKIRFYGEYEQYNEGNPIVVPWEFTVERNAEKEEDLVCNPNPAWSASALQNLVSAGFFFDIAPVFYKSIENDEFIFGCAIGGELENVLLEQEISFSSIPADPGSQEFELEIPADIKPGEPPLQPEKIKFTNSPPEFSLPGTINAAILEYWSYGGTYDTATGQPL